jgi:hypothetical protein
MPSCDEAAVTARAKANGFINLVTPFQRGLMVQLLCEISTAVGGGGGAVGVISTDGGPSWTTARFTIDGEDPGTGDVFVTAAPTAGEKIIIDDIIISSQSVDMRIVFKEETSNTVLLPINLLAGLVPQLTTRGKIKLPTADKRLVMSSSVVGLVDGVILYHSEA